MPTLKEILTEENIKTISEIAKEWGYINVRLLCHEEDEEDEISGTLMLIADEDPDVKDQLISPINAVLEEKLQCQVHLRQMKHMNWLEVYDTKKHCAPLNDLKKIEELFEKSLDKVIIKHHEERGYFVRAKRLSDSILKKRKVDTNNVSITAVNSPLRAQTPPPQAQESSPKKQKVDDLIVKLRNPNNKSVLEKFLLDLPEEQINKLDSQVKQQEQHPPIIEVK